jgi:hypothetical protein
MSWKNELRKKDKVNTAKKIKTPPVEFDFNIKNRKSMFVKPRKRELTPEEKRMKELGHEYQDA